MRAGGSRSGRDRHRTGRIIDAPTDGAGERSEQGHEVERHEWMPGCSGGPPITYPIRRLPFLSCHNTQVCASLQTALII